MAGESSSTKTIMGVAAASAAASSLITYAVFKWYLRRERIQREQGLVGPASNSSPLANLTREVAPDHFAPHIGTSEDFQLPVARTDPYDSKPRQGYLSWDDYFMAVAFLSSQRSKDPAKQVGACIVDKNNVICGIGYNGFPRGCSDEELPWSKRSRDGDPLATKYPYVCHAEMNAILNKNGASVAGARVYVTMFPCNECAKLMIQAGIGEIVFHEDKAQPRAETPALGSFKLSQQYAASKRLLKMAGVKVRQHLFRRPVTLILSNHAYRALWEHVPSDLEVNIGEDGLEISNTDGEGAINPPGIVQLTALQGLEKTLSFEDL